MADVLSRVQALLIRAADEGATEEEARTSALIAARLIKKHGVRVTLGEAEAINVSKLRVVQEAKARIWAAERLAEIAEIKAAEAEDRARKAEQRAEQAEARAQEADRRVLERFPGKRTRRPVD